MLSLNDRAWKEFTFEQLFIVKRGQSVYKQYMKRGNIPYVSASASNNGITDYVDKPNRAANMISLAYDGSVGSAFYQNTPWFASEKIVSLELKDHQLNRYIAMFLCRVIHNQKDKYNYAYKWSVGIRMMRSKILIPITDKGSPDYAFMEQYIREREDKFKQKYIDFIGNNYQIGGVLPSLENKMWKNFMLAEIFKVDLSKGDNQPSLLEEGRYPLISAGTKNNGVCRFIKEGDGKSQLFEKNAITVDMFGTPFYHDYDFYSVSHGRVNILTAISGKFNKYVGLFIVSCITEGAKSKYTYNQMCSQKRILRQPIMLPITDDGSPDYDYMEQYIKAVMFGKYKKYLEYQRCLMR